ncbi:MAG: DUF4435 domain-containing protein [Candidatus Poribacteria bacterium]|nr:DUF4435 domain-containing protein [Candidatus Poribacteria bacterium]
MNRELRRDLSLTVPKLSDDTGKRLQDLISHIRHSGQKRMVVVEGKTDKVLYRWMYKSFEAGWVRVFYAGNIDELLKIYAQKDKLFDKRGVAVAFMADRDLERLFCTNPQPEDIIWTEGYCIENDLYEGYVKDNFEMLLEVNEKKKLQEMRDAIVKWFAFEYQLFKKKRNAKVGTDLDTLVPKGSTHVDPKFLEEREFKEPNEDLVDKFKSDYNLRVAGKLLFQMLDRILGHTDRKNRDSSDIGSLSYKLGQLYEMAGKIPNSKTERLIKDINAELEKQEKAINVKKSRSTQSEHQKPKSGSSKYSTAAESKSSEKTDHDVEKLKSTRRRKRRRPKTSSSGHSFP